VDSYRCLRSAPRARELVDGGGFRGGRFGLSMGVAALIRDYSSDRWICKGGAPREETRRQDICDGVSGVLRPVPQ
jgi:hypothetical protein